MREIVLFMVDSWAERAHLGSAPLQGFVDFYGPPISRGADI